MAVETVRGRQIRVYRSPTDVERLTDDDELSGGDMLPGSWVPVAELSEEI